MSAPPDPAASHRAALDHVLALCAGRWWSDSLVLRGSMLLPTWLGPAARPPADLDWVVVGPAHDPETGGDVRTGAEIPGGDLGDLLRRYPEIEWAERDGPVAVTRRPDPPDVTRPYGDLLDLVARRPRAARGVVLRAADATIVDDWAYSGYQGAGVRLRIPWHAPGLPDGAVQLDFAADEHVPETPEPTLVPRADGGPPTVVLAVSRELSLAWKLLWLYRDAGYHHGDWDDSYGPTPTARGKDLYDAVLLAEGCRTAALPGLLRAVWADGDVDALDDLADWPVAWESFRAAHPWVSGSARDWAGRLVAALPPTSDIPPYSRVRPSALRELADQWNGARS
ncbi:MAG TPA: nucleotidyl transferase AbiEii/AbiGii toxin family protein [Actinocatenispora sp.]